MAKRHKHYTGTRKKRSNGSGGSRGKVNHKMKHLRKRQQSDQQGQKNDVVNNWFNSSLPMGNGDLSLGMESSDMNYSNPGRAVISAQNVEDYYFGRRKEKSMKQGGFRLGRRNNTSNDFSFANSSFRKRPMVFVKAAEVYDPSHDLILQLTKNQERRSSLTQSSPLRDIEFSDGKDEQYSDFESSDESDRISHVSGHPEKYVSEQYDITDSESLDTETSESDDDVIVENNEYEASSSGNNADKMTNLTNEELFFVDDSGYFNYNFQKFYLSYYWENKDKYCDGYYFYSNFIKHSIGLSF